jgi:thymidylate synthase
MQQYLTCLQHILDNGIVKDNRTGVKTRSVFGYQMRFNMADGFPLLTSKRVFIKGIIHELLWMISGSANIRPLVKEGVSIWTDWPLKHYNQCNPVRPMSKKDFESAIIDDLEFALEWGELGPVYGKQWRRWQCPSKLGLLSAVPSNVSWFPPVNWKNPDEVFWTPNPIDQLQNVIDEICVNPMSRRLIVSAWNPADIEEMAVSGLPPCHCFFQFNCRPLTLRDRLILLKEILDAPHVYNDSLSHDTYNFLLEVEGNTFTLDALIEAFTFRENTIPPLTSVIEAYLDNPHDVHRKDVKTEIQNIPKYKLDLMLTQRSGDIGLGIPYNIASYSLLLHMVAQITNTVPGDFVHSIGDAHIYENHLDQVYTQLEREPKPLPALILNPRKKIDDFVFSDVKIEGYDPHPAIKGEVAV